MKGRKPKTAEELRLAGEQGQVAVVIGGRTPPPAPPHMSPEMKVAWETIVTDLVAADVIDKADGGVLEAAASMWARARQARAEMAKEMRVNRTLMESTPQGRVPNRLLTIERESWREFRALAESLPLSPWGRARLGLKSKTSGTGAEADIGLPPRLRAVPD